ncbi:hypothetical protein SAMN02910298_02790 [Pseudobutyrivibrio sp. YE44]|uniref:hypothetical protein n=1 Tax=Pseudobutyrivibrio sp. YE44 TaxID=1520802 RepID=UPI0008874E5E|nr:hypothetical protein [Pseudobutyrivibrio sp. YE44]SDB54451.1 hypothetical protein SAMN02910298_02790 [Pseudobutyrivibrio sp. YE44]
MQKKVEKIIAYINSIIIIFAAIYFPIVIVVSLFKSILPKQILPVASWTVYAGSLLLMVVCIVFIIGGIISAIISATKNYKGIDEPVFRQIDMFLKTWNETNNSYLRMIVVINAAYGESGEIQQYIADGRLDVLFQRKNDLENSINGPVHEKDDIAAWFISLIAAVFYEKIINENSNDVKTVAWVIFIILIFAVILFRRYLSKGHGNSYKYNIREYELKLLEKKIDNMMSETIATNMDYIENQQRTISVLIDKALHCHNNKKREQIVSDINLIDSLPLDLHEFPEESYDGVYNALKSNGILDGEKL